MIAIKHNSGVHDCSIKLKRITKFINVLCDFALMVYNSKFEELQN